MDSEELGAPPLKLNKREHVSAEVEKGKKVREELLSKTANSPKMRS